MLVRRMIDDMAELPARGSEIADLPAQPFIDLDSQPRITGHELLGPGCQIAQDRAGFESG